MKNMLKVQNRCSLKLRINKSRIETWPDSLKSSNDGQMFDKHAAQTFCSGFYRRKILAVKHPRRPAVAIYEVGETKIQAVSRF